MLLVHAGTAWYGQDVVRNEPFLANRPKVMFLNRLTPAQMEALSSRGPVRVLTPAELKELGMFVIGGR